MRRLYEASTILCTVDIMTDALKKLLDAAKSAEPTPEHREMQRRSFAYGNTAFENDRITREMVDRQAEKLAREADDASKK